MTLLEQKTAWLEAQDRKQQIKDIIAPRHATLNAQIAMLHEKFEKENAEMLEVFETVTKEVAEVEAMLRGNIVSEYEKRGEPDNKTLGDGMGVQVRETITISDEDAALAWAKKEAPFLLIVDAKQLKDLAKKQNFAFVTKTKSVNAVIKA
jgi:hypothetical protein